MTTLIHRSGDKSDENLTFPALTGSALELSPGKTSSGAMGARDRCVRINDRFVVSKKLVKQAITITGTIFDISRSP